MIITFYYTSSFSSSSSFLILPFLPLFSFSGDGGGDGGRDGGGDCDVTVSIL